MFFRRFLTRKEGQGLVEMALMLPILLLIFMAIIEFGRIFGSYIIVDNLAREGARYGVVGHNDVEIRQKINEERTYLDIDKLTVTTTSTWTPGDPLEVRVDYSLPLITPVISGMVPNPFPLSARCFMRVE